ncbi:MAG: hypothetical protein ACKPKO_45540, partial [Candidatus Fonsibacter sp.]
NCQVPVSGMGCKMAVESNIQFMKRYEGLPMYSDKLKFALQVELDRSGSFMVVYQTHFSVCVDNLVLRMVGWRAPWWPTSLFC